MKGPSARRLQHYASTRLGLDDYLDACGDGRCHPRIPARCLLWALLVVKVLRVASLHATEWLVRHARTSLGVERGFSDDTLAYFLERLAPQHTRRALAVVLKRAKRNKVFEGVVHVGIALDGTGLGRTVRRPCALCHPYVDAQGEVVAHGHHFVVASVVGAGIVLPFDAEPIETAENELSAAKRLLPRAVTALGPRFADYLVLDSLYAGAPFLTLAQSLGLHVVVGLKSNMPDLLDHARTRFGGMDPTDSFSYRDQRIELWDAEDVEASATLPWPSVRVLGYRRIPTKGPPVEGYCYTTFSKRRVGSRALFRMHCSRWEIENQGFNDAKNRYGLEHLPHHEANSVVLHALLTCLALCIERLYRLRHLHRGTHMPLTAAELHKLFWLALAPEAYHDSS